MRRSVRRARPGLVLFLAAAMVLPFAATMQGAAGGFSLFGESLPDISHLSAASLLRQDVIIRDRNGKLLADLGSHGDHRVVVPLSQISPQLIKATVDVEDHTFWTNSGIDPQGITRAAIADYQHRQIQQGGSTITQQLVKLLFLTPSQSVQRKATEAYLALRVSQEYSKPQILEMYLNTIFYGDQAYGAEAASEAFFHTSAAQLDLAQASMLAGLPSSPSELDPIDYPDRAHARQTEVLQAMVAQHDINSAQAQAASAEQLQFFRPENHFQAPHFVDYVLQQLERQLGLSADQLTGLTVTTTLDLDKQQLAEQTVADQVSGLSYQNVTDGALVALDPTNGEILSMVGAADYNGPGGHINMADTPRQPGSSFKLFTYTAAIESRQFTMETAIPDVPLAVPDGDTVWTPQNYDHRFHGMVPLRIALGNSLNIPAVRVELALGTATVVDEARRMGVTSLTQPDDYYGPSLTLGGYEITLLDLATGAATLADLGVRHAPAAILKITDSRGNVIYRYDESSNHAAALDPGVAYVMAQTMSQDRNRWMEFGVGSDLTLPDRTVAAKTGTTNDFRDNLTVGFTPHLVTAVWVGNADNSPMINSTGITGAAPIWHRFMDAALAATPDEWYDTPSDVEPSGGSYFLLGTRLGGYFYSFSPEPGESPFPYPFLSPTPAVSPEPVATPGNAPPSPLASPSVAAVSPSPTSAPSAAPSPSPAASPTSGSTPQPSPTH